MQQKNDGTHAILPAATHFTCKVDHAGVPVMWLRHADVKLRRDGIRAALLQRHYAVAERGRVHGAPGLACVVQCRGPSWIRGPCRNRGDQRQWVRARKKPDRLRGQDKSHKVRPVGWLGFAWKFRCALNIVKIQQNLRFRYHADHCSMIHTLRAP